MVNSPKWQRLPLPEVFPSKTKCVQITIPDAPYYDALLYGAVAWLAFWDAYDRDDLKRGKDVAALWKEAIKTLERCPPQSECPPELPECIEICGDDIYINAEDCMGKVNVYSGCGCDCDCGGGKNVAGGEEGAASAGMVTDFPPDGVTVPVDCYAQKSVNYLLDRARDFTVRVVEVSELGWDALLGDWDEAIELARVSAAILRRSSDYETIAELSEASVVSAFDDVEFRNKMIASWGFEGDVSKADLFEWVKSAPGFVNVVPMRFALNFWLEVSFVPGYGMALSQFANECAYSNELPGGAPQVDPFAVIATRVSGDGLTTYELYEDFDYQYQSVSYDDSGDIVEISPDRNGELVAAMVFYEILTPYPEQTDNGWRKTLQQKQMAANGNYGTLASPLVFSPGAWIWDAESVARFIGAGDIATSEVNELIELIAQQYTSALSNTYQFDLTGFTPTADGVTRFTYNTDEVGVDSIVRMRHWSVFARAT